MVNKGHREELIKEDIQENVHLLTVILHLSWIMPVHKLTSIRQS